MINPELIIKDFVEYQKALNMSASTIELSESALNKFFDYLETEGVDLLTDVNTKLMLRFQIHLSKLLTSNGASYNPRTQNAIISNVRKLFRYLRRKGEVFVNPTEDMELAKAPRPMPRNILSLEEAQALLNQPNKRTLSGKRDRAILACLYDGGLRRGECCGLDVNDIYLDEKKIHIRDGKGGLDRVVPIQDDTAKRLRAYIEEVRPLILDDPKDQAVFLNKYGRRLNAQSVLRIVKAEAKKAGIKKDIHPHTLRHSIATHLADNGVDIRYIQEFLGHSRCDTTAIYIHLSGGRLRKVLNAYHPRAKVREKVA